MISIDQARSLVLQNTSRAAAVRQAVARVADLVLAEDVTSDVDSPPFDKALVDGYAVVAADVQQPARVLEVVERVHAGQTPRRLVTPGRAAQIMTGAPIPQGADAVVMVEQTVERSAADRRLVQVDAGPLSPGHNVLLRGQATRRGDIVLAKGRRLLASDVGVLCEAGRSSVRVVRPPRVAVASTGDELVAADLIPHDGQIRNSNGPMLCALARSARADASDLGIARDDLPTLLKTVARGLQFDVLLLSGGVSAGTRDLVPRVLHELAVTQIFHKVCLKPGKPLWFGTYGRGRQPTLVFGLPGNPVGSLVCFELFVRPALRKMQGQTRVVPALGQARLGGPYHQQSDRPTYAPAVAKVGQDDQVVVDPVRWQGSADLFAVGRANCLAFFPSGDEHYAAGRPVGILWLDEPDRWRL
jgi:molybdopterin molybdotransferase